MLITYIQGGTPAQILEVAKGYSNATVRPSVRLSFRNILVNTLESTSFNGFWPN